MKIYIQSILHFNIFCIDCYRVMRYCCSIDFFIVLTRLVILKTLQICARYSPGQIGDRCFARGDLLRQTFNLFIITKKYHKKAKIASCNRSAVVDNLIILLWTNLIMNHAYFVFFSCYISTNSPNIYRGCFPLDLLRDMVTMHFIYGQRHSSL